MRLLSQSARQARLTRRQLDDKDEPSEVALSERKECPLCGETLRLRIRDVPVRTPGRPGLVSQRQSEWICVECDYFEEAEITPAERTWRRD
jgi:hypothetical protein